MPDFMKRILWATDFSDEAQEALLYASNFTRVFKSKLTALHVVPDFSPALYNTSFAIRGELAKRVNLLKKEAKKKLENIKKTKGISYKTIVKEGSTSKKVFETAQEEKTDLIVIGKRGLSAVEKLFIGSVANQVLRNSLVPVLITKRGKQKIEIKKILVPTDFSPQEEVERDYAWKLAKGFDADLTLLNVLELHDYEFSPQVLDEMFDAVLRRLRKRKKIEKEDIKVKEEVCRAINASLGIVDFAETHKFDLIVMSTYVRSKLERFFLGSTTEKVISYTHIPVLAIPPKGDKD